MLGTCGLFLFTVCFVCESSTSPSDTARSRDLNYEKPNQMLVSHIKKVLESMSLIQVTVHPRVRHLYELLKKEVHQDAEYGQRHNMIDFNQTLGSKYDATEFSMFTTLGAADI